MFNWNKKFLLGEPVYHQRRVTSLNVQSALYEIKLISLLYLRAFLDDSIEMFELAANVDHMDLFGDICFKAKVKGFDKPVEVFIQARYKQKYNKTIISHLEKSFCSYLKIRQQFDQSVLRGAFDEFECVFVIYTNGTIDFTTVTQRSGERAFSVKLNDLIGTGGTGEHILYNQLEYFDLLCEVVMKNQMISLAEQIAKFLSDDDNFPRLLTDETMLQYHVILAQKVFNVSGIQPDGHRIATFRGEFFETKEEYLTIFKNTLIKAVQIKRKIETNEQKIIEILSTLHFKVPIAFGNKDLTIKKVEKRITYLATEICHLLENCDKGTIVTVDETLSDGFLRLNGGIAGTIGNIFVLDDNYKLLKITDNTEQLEPFAKMLYTKIKDKVPNLHGYKFCFKVSKFPKLSFDISQYEENLVSDFLKRLVLYSNQADVYEVEEILKSEIGNYLRYQPSYLQAETDVTLLRYSDQIQKWWLIPKHAPVLTRENDLLKKTIHKTEHILIKKINANCMSKIKHYNYTFNEFAVKYLKLQKDSNTLIITENSILTVVKVIQYLKDEAHVLLNLEYIASLPMDDLVALRKELKYTNKDEVLILVCDDIQKKNINILKIFTARKRNMMIITNETSLKTVQKCFQVDNTINDKKFGLIDLSKESQMSIFETATVIIPGMEEEIKLDLLLPQPVSRSVGDAAADDKSGTGYHRTGGEEGNASGTSYESVLRP